MLMLSSPLSVSVPAAVIVPPAIKIPSPVPLLATLVSMVAPFKVFSDPASMYKPPPSPPPVLSLFAVFLDAGVLVML